MTELACADCGVERAPIYIEVGGVRRCLPCYEAMRQAAEAEGDA